MPWSGPTCCVPSCSTGPTWCAISFAASRPTPRLMAYDGVRALLKPAPVDTVAGPVLPMHFSKGDVSLKLFTTIATLGTPQDITLQEMRIESFFPMDRDTALVLRTWAVEARKPN